MNVQTHMIIGSKVKRLNLWAILALKPVSAGLLTFGRDATLPWNGCRTILMVDPLVGAT